MLLRLGNVTTVSVSLVAVTCICAASVLDYFSKPWAVCVGVFVNGCVSVDTGCVGRVHCKKERLF